MFVNCKANLHIVPMLLAAVVILKLLLDIEVKYRPKLLKVRILAYRFNLKFVQKKMEMSDKCYNNNHSDNPRTSRRTDGGKNRTSAQLISFYM